MLRIILPLLLLPLLAFAQDDTKPIGRVTYLHHTNLIGENELNGDAIVFQQNKVNLYPFKCSERKLYKRGRYDNIHNNRG